ncbi:AtzE family amidohydrolase [Oricola indica]|jgi:AtzE family amidohydrolase|uniref:AtzE family amidohydrolase n=1 Tax=Oricola indica TaxID=2872591 RepID=UPI001CBFDD03|nr:AtzE family amidohydrolase [Oricola indica]
MTDFAGMTGADIAAAVRNGSMTARTAVEASLVRTEKLNPSLNGFTAITAERALSRADSVDADIAAGRDPGPLAGVPFAVKNLFDVKGLSTLAGSKINRDLPPAGEDATLIRRMEAAGAILTGALNMGEYAYDFTGQNVHDGASRNPHDPDHMSGGSSGGSGTATASGMVPITLGSDTNGSIRVPSSLCGLFGLKPTYGRLSRGGTFPFVASLDHLGPIARSATDLALSYDAMQGPDPQDPACTDRAVEPVTGELDRGIEGLRIAKAGGYFASGALPEAFEAVQRVAAAVNATRTVDIADAKAARGAAYLITMAEGASLHLDRMRTRHADYDPDVRDRLIAGAMIPGAWVTKAQKLRRIFRDTVLKLFEEVDVILAPATPCRAPKIGQQTMVLDGVEMPVRPNMGIFTQPISFIGLPVVSVPVWTEGEKLPIGVQLIAAPWREDFVLRLAHHLEKTGAVCAPVAKHQGS